MLRIAFIVLLLLTVCTNAFAAVGCSLDDPDRDVKRLFPESTGYKTTFVTLKEIGGEALQQQIEEKLGDKLDSLYETLDVPYAYYTVLKGKEAIGYVHGVNQKGKFGVLQLVIATDTQAKIKAFYYQKLSSLESDRFQDPAFTAQFKGLSLADYSAHASKIADPSTHSAEDFQATLRGIKKDLILLDTFLKAKTGGNK